MCQCHVAAAECARIQAVAAQFPTLRELAWDTLCPIVAGPDCTLDWSAVMSPVPPLSFVQSLSPWGHDNVRRVSGHLSGWAATARVRLGQWPGCRVWTRFLFTLAAVKCVTCPTAAPSPHVLSALFLYHKVTVVTTSHDSAGAVLLRAARYLYDSTHPTPSIANYVLYTDGMALFRLSDGGYGGDRCMLSLDTNPPACMCDGRFKFSLHLRSHRDPRLTLAQHTFPYTNFDWRYVQAMHWRTIYARLSANAPAS